MDTIARLNSLLRHYGGAPLDGSCGAKLHHVLNDLDRQARMDTTGGYHYMIMGEIPVNPVGARVALHEINAFGVSKVKTEGAHFWLGEQTQNA